MASCDRESGLWPQASWLPILLSFRIFRIEVTLPSGTTEGRVSEQVGSALVWYQQTLFNIQTKMSGHPCDKQLEEGLCCSSIAFSIGTGDCQPSWGCGGKLEGGSQMGHMTYWSPGGAATNPLQHLDLGRYEPFQPAPGRAHPWAPTWLRAIDTWKISSV